MTSRLAVAFTFLAFVWRVLGGDAVAIGHNAQGVWTAVTYYNSSTPKGGRDYKNEADAREEALRDLRTRAGENLAKASILSSSNATGYVAVGRGKDRSGRDVNVVGRGKTQSAADDDALDQLKRAGATEKQSIVYRYFSHGPDSAAQ